MDIESIRAYCLSKKASSESFPFDEDTLVFKVAGKMFALISVTREPMQINLKCEPNKAIQLREEYPDRIIPGWHMNKKHWNTVYIEQIEGGLLSELIDHSYDLVRQSLTKKARIEFGLD